MQYINQKSVKDFLDEGTKAGNITKSVVIVTAVLTLCIVIILLAVNGGDYNSASQLLISLVTALVVGGGASATAVIARSETSKRLEELGDNAVIALTVEDQHPAENVSSPETPLVDNEEYPDEVLGITSYTGK